MRNQLPSPSTELQSEAAYWYNLRLADEMDAENECRFDEWIARSPAHRKAYQTVERGWYIAGHIGEKRDHGDLQTPHPKSPNWRLRSAIAAALILTITVGYSIIPYFPYDHANSTAQNFQTAIGQRSKITLPEGTVVTLDSETEMTFTALDNERSVEMVRGRAFFAVAKDVDRPFVVHAGGKTVKALGTAFEVRIDRNEVAVILAEGKVRVQDAGSKASTDMSPGRRLTIASDRQWTMSKVDVSKETSWTSGRLIFMNDTLSSALSEVNRYSTKKIIFHDGDTPSTSIVGIFSVGDVDGFVKALEMQGIATTISSSSDEVILSPQ